MPQSLLERIASLGDDPSYYEEGFQQLILLNLSYFKKQENRFKGVTPQENERYRGNFIALLESYNIEPKYHFLICQFNGILNPQAYDGHLEVIVIPNFNTFERLHMLYKTEKN